MEITCSRCHQTVQSENCYCPTCGMPQLLYATDSLAGSTQPAHWEDAVPDAGSIHWKSALRAAMLLAVPAGVLCCGVSPVGLGGIIWMAAAAAWAVVLYARIQQPAWITSGAGARIGLVTGILAGWLGFGVSGVTLYIQRVVFHHAAGLDAEWKSSIGLLTLAGRQMNARWTSGMGAADAAQFQANQAWIYGWMLTPWGHAGYVVASLGFYAAFLLLFAAAGGALGARMMRGARRPLA